jgi:DNA-binding transcriptional MerR regulator
MKARDRVSYSIRESAEATGVSVDTIRRAIRVGHLVPRYPTARGVLFADELRAWIENSPTERKTA